MATYRRNVLVGITVLASMVMLAWMIVRFGGNIAKPFAGEQFTIRFHTQRGDGLSEGSAITYLGIPVGRVTAVNLDPNKRDIWVEALIEAKFELPANVEGVIRQASLLGSASNIALEVIGDDLSKTIQQDTVLPARFVGLDFFPPEIRQISAELAVATKQFRESNLIGNLNDRVTQIGKVLEEARKTVDGVNTLINDKALRDDIRSSVADIRRASENARNVTETADKVAKKLDTSVASIGKTIDQAQIDLQDIAKLTKARLAEASTLLAQANEITTKLNTGKGTAGLLVNDPKLYEGLVDTTAQLTLTITDLKRLVQQWEEEGVTVKLR
jgi:phospholipid/cholesterol/gamma-HCH transport system substrate-binding protein